MQSDDQTMTATATRRQTLFPYLALAGAALFWSGNFVVGRALRGDIPPISLNFWRWTVALALLLPLSYPQLRQYRAQLRREWKLIGALGLTGMAVFQTCVYTALQTTTAVNALLFLALTPVAIVFGSWLVFRDTLTVRQILGVGVSLLGAVILIARGSLATLLGLQLNPGDVWMLVAVVTWAIYSILVKRRPADLPQLAMLTGSVIVGVLLLLPVYTLRALQGEGLAFNLPNLLGILYVALFASILAFLAWNNGVAQIGPNRAGLFIHLMPVFGALLSFLFLGEGIAPFHIVGALFVFSGIGLMSRRRTRARLAATRQHHRRQEEQ